MSLVDLSHPLAPGQQPYPGDPAFDLAVHATVAADGFRVSRLVTGTHQGTHLDAMAHALEDGRTIDQMPLDWFYGPAHILRLPKEPRAEITVADLLPYEAILQPASRVILATGWWRRFGTPEFFTDSPALTAEACRYLASRRLRLLGMDLPTPGREAEEIHRLLLAKDVEMVLVESLANLDAVPDEFLLVAFPLPLRGGDGSPVRAVAVC
jgi:kynurenine formamidase